ncbi:MAG: MarR family transcriptional regulator [Rhodomicrobium sp.]
MPRKGGFSDIAFPALLRAARATYGSAIHEALIDAGHDDVPRNGIYVIGAIARTAAPLSQIISELGISKQAAGQLVDTLVMRGYLHRSVDTKDRRRLTIRLTERGRAVASVSKSAIERLDAEFGKKAGSEHFKHTRATLAIIAEGGRTKKSKS